MQSHSQLKRFTIESQTSSSFNVTKYSSSKEDIIMYNTEKFVSKEGVIGAAILSYNGEEGEDDIIEEEEGGYDIVEGVAGELKLDPQEKNQRQLIANMIKVAGDLALIAVKNKQRIFDKIKIYGLLVNCKDGSTQILSLLIDFPMGERTLQLCKDPQDFNVCIIKLCNALDPVSG